MEQKRDNGLELRKSEEIQLFVLYQERSGKCNNCTMRTSGVRGGETVCRCVGTARIPVSMFP